MENRVGCFDCCDICFRAFAQLLFSKRADLQHAGPLIAAEVMEAVTDILRQDHSFHAERAKYSETPWSVSRDQAVLQVRLEMSSPDRPISTESCPLCQLDMLASAAHESVLFDMSQSESNEDQRIDATANLGARDKYHALNHATNAGLKAYMRFSHHHRTDEDTRFLECACSGLKGFLKPPDEKGNPTMSRQEIDDFAAAYIWHQKNCTAPETGYE